LGGTAGPVCWKALPPNFCSVEPRENRGPAMEQMAAARDCPMRQERVPQKWEPALRKDTLKQEARAR
jgi:hypothetical protein